LFTACKVIAVVAVVVSGFTVDRACRQHFERGAMEHDEVHAHGFLLAVIAGLFAFGGWHVVTYTAEETVQSRAHDSASAHARIVIVTSCYVALNAVYFYVLPMDRIRNPRASPPTRPRRCSARPAGRRSRAGDVLGVRRDDRQHSRGAARLLRDGRDGCCSEW
jgi:L-asparagine transporter-like permease